MAKSSSSSSSSSSEEVSQAAGQRITPGLYNPCLILEAVKSVILKCLGVDHDFIKNQGNQKQKEEASSSNPQESCSTATDDHEQNTDPPPSTTANPEAGSPTEDGVATSFAMPPRPGASTGRGPRIN